MRTDARSKSRGQICLYYALREGGQVHEVELKEKGLKEKEERRKEKGERAMQTEWFLKTLQPYNLTTLIHHIRRSTRNKCLEVAYEDVDDAFAGFACGPCNVGRDEGAGRGE